jgi:hypothetical protein
MTVEISINIINITIRKKKVQTQENRIRLSPQNTSAVSNIISKQTKITKPGGRITMWKKIKEKIKEILKTISAEAEKYPIIGNAIKSFKAKNYILLTMWVAVIVLIAFVLYSIGAFIYKYRIAILAIVGIVGGLFVIPFIASLKSGKNEEINTLPIVPINTALREFFKKLIIPFMSETLNPFIKQVALPDMVIKGFEKLIDWTDSNSVYWCKLTYLRLPGALELDEATLEQLRKLLDIELQHVIRRSVHYSNDWTARVYKLATSDSRLAVTVLFVDCPVAEVIAEELDGT